MTAKEQRERDRSMFRLLFECERDILRRSREEGTGGVLNPRELHCKGAGERRPENIRMRESWTARERKESGRRSGGEVESKRGCSREKRSIRTFSGWF